MTFQDANRQGSKDVVGIKRCDNSIRRQMEEHAKSKIA